MERSLFDSFAHEFFTKRTFMIEHNSLNAMLEISKHPTLSPMVRDVIITCHKFAWTKHGAVEVAFDKANLVLRPALLSTGVARDILVQAFSNLKNVRTVSYRDYFSRGRPRDSRHIWRSYGHRMLIDGLSQEDSQFEDMYSVYPDNRGDPLAIFPLLVYSLSAASARPAALDVILRQPDGGLRGEAFQLLSALPGDAMKSMLCNLTQLYLSISFHRDSEETEHHSFEWHHLLRFLSNATSLRSLRLNQGDVCFRDEHWLYELFWHLRQDPEPDESSDSKTLVRKFLPSLKSLELGVLFMLARMLPDIFLLPMAQRLVLHRFQIVVKVDDCDTESRRAVMPKLFKLLADVVESPETKAPWPLNPYCKLQHTQELVISHATLTSEFPTSSQIPCFKNLGVLFSHEDGSDKLSPVATFRAIDNNSGLATWLRDLAERTTLDDAHLEDVSALAGNGQT